MDTAGGHVLKVLVATFDDPDALLAGAQEVRGRGFTLIDALTPYPLDSVSDILGASVSPRLRGPMALAGFGVAGALFAFEGWTAVIAYPVNEGGRPLFSWPVFLLSPFELGVLAAAITGFAVFLVRCGLPRLNHGLFDVPGIERASQDRFHLVVDPVDRERIPDLATLLFSAGALSVSEADT